jgi:hypothetical protein
MTETAIDSGFTRDVYVALGELLNAEDEADVWSVRVYYKPFVTWIWGGCLLMALGGALAASDRRYRMKARRSLVQGYRRIRPELNPIGQAATAAGAMSRDSAERRAVKNLRSSSG